MHHILSIYHSARYTLGPNMYLLYEWINKILNLLCEKGIEWLYNCFKRSIPVSSSVKWTWISVYPIHVPQNMKNWGVHVDIEDSEMYCSKESCLTSFLPSKAQIHLRTKPLKKTRLATFYSSVEYRLKNTGCGQYLDWFWIGSLSLLFYHPSI